MFPFKSPLLESLWSTTASFEPQAQKQKPKLGFLREGLALTQQGPRAAEERGIETPALPQRWNMYKSWICTPQMCHFVKYSRVCGHCPLKTTLCSLFESTALDPRVGCTGAGADFRHTQSSLLRTSQQLGWHGCSHSPRTQFCLVVPFPDLNIPQGIADPLSVHVHRELPRISFYFKSPFTPSARMEAFNPNSSHIPTNEECLPNI